MGYVPCPDGETGAEMLSSSYEIDVAGTKIEAIASLKPLYDPASQRVKA